MKEVIDFLNENRNGFMATVVDGNPGCALGLHVRGEWKVILLYKQRQGCLQTDGEYPHVEFSMMNSGNAWIRISGGITFTEDQECKARVLGASEVVKSVYRTADNPLLKVFYIEHGRAVMADFSGQPPKTFTF
jgi:uncharacterized pyridoxamine 5'-phosphate oxidase family protein